MYSKQNVLLIMNFDYVRSMCCWGGEGEESMCAIG